MTEWKNIPDNYEDYLGFIYLITNKTNGRFYIGQKSFWKIVKYPPLKGKVNRRYRKKETKWREYWGSSEWLLRDIEKLGEDNFEREILKLCKNKTELNFFETKMQIEKDVLGIEDSKNKEKSYNGILNLRIGGR